MFFHVQIGNFKYKIQVLTERNCTFFKDFKVNLYILCMRGGSISGAAIFVIYRETHFSSPQELLKIKR